MRIKDCAICAVHLDGGLTSSFEIARNSHWVLRHHANPVPRVGWLLLDSLRHLSGPIDFSDEEAASWGYAVRKASSIVKSVTGCDRVYAIAFGEGAQHLHMHLIPRFVLDPETKAWTVADLYRSVEVDQSKSVDAHSIQSFVHSARNLVAFNGF